MTVHVSIHDVSPAWRSEIELALEMCHAVGCKPALLVVPNFHGEHPLERDPSFCASVAKLQEDGHEVYLHGFFHAAGAPRLRDDARPGNAASTFFAQRVVSGGEAEFSDVSELEARARLDEGERVRRRGPPRRRLRPPAWSMPRFVHRLLADRGVRYTEDHLRVYDPPPAVAAPAWCSTTPAARRGASSPASPTAASRSTRVALPARIAIHPRTCASRSCATRCRRCSRGRAATWRGAARISSTECPRAEPPVHDGAAVGDRTPERPSPSERQDAPARLSSADTAVPRNVRTSRPARPPPTPP